MSETVDLPPVRVLNDWHSSRLRYWSDAANPMGVARTLFDQRTQPDRPSGLQYTIKIGAEYRHLNYAPDNSVASQQQFFWNAMSATGQKVPSGSYPYEAHLISLMPGWLVESNMPDEGPVPVDTGVNGLIKINNQQQSPFGAGWTLEDLKELHLNPDGSVLLVRGTGETTHYAASLGLGLVAGRLDSSGYSGDGSLATTATLNTPVGFVADSSGNLFFSDSRNNVIRRIDVSGRIDTVVGSGVAGYGGDGGPALGAMMRTPTHLAMDGQGNLYVLDSGNMVIRRIDTLGTITTVVGGPGSMFLARPSGVAVTTGGDLYYSDSDQNGVWKLPAASPTPVLVAGGNGTRFSEEYTLATSSALQDPQALAFDESSGSLYIAERGKDRIRRVDSLGVISTVAGGGKALLDNVPATQSSLHLMQGTPIVVDRNGDLFFSGGDGGVLLRRVNRGGTVNLVVGSTTVADAFDGSGAQEGLSTFPTNASWQVVSGLGLGADGRLVFGTASLISSGSYVGVLGASNGRPFFKTPVGETSVLSRVPVPGTGYVLRAKDGTVDTFDAAGLLQTSTDRRGNQTTYQRTADGTLTGIVDPVGQVTSFAYNSSGKLTTITDPAGRVTTLSIDGAGDLVSVRLPDLGTWTYTYADHLLVKIVSPRGLVTTIGYDGHQMARTLKESDTGTRTFIPADSLFLINDRATPMGVPSTSTMLISTSAHVSTLTDALNRRTRFWTDNSEAPVKTVDALGRIVTTMLDSQGLPATKILVDGSMRRMTWDSKRNLLTSQQSVPATTGPLTHQTPIIVSWVYQYDPVFSLPTAITDPRGATAHLTYDGRGNLISQEDALSEKVVQTFNARGQVLTRTNKRGFTWVYEYNAQGNLSTITAPGGGVTRLRYDGAGNITSRTDTRGNETRMSYDTMGRLTSVTDPRGNSRTMEYDREGNQVAEVDELGNRTTQEFSNRNQVVTRTNALSRARHWTYDLERALATMTDEKGRETTYERDLAGRIFRETRAGGSQYSYQYDIFDNLAQMTDPEGRTQKFIWDSMSHMIGEVDGKGVLVRELVFDVAGDLQSTYDARGVHTIYVRDRLGRVIEVNSSGSDGTWQGVFQVLDANGNVTSRTINSGAPTVNEYDSLDRLVATTEAAGYSEQVTVRREYDSESNLTALVNGKGARWTFTYDTRNLLVSEQDPGTPPNTTSYDYDAARNLYKKVDAKQQTTTWTFDALNRWTVKSYVGGQESREFDDTGQVTTVSDGATSIARSYDSQDRLTGYSIPSISRTVSIEYDRSGLRKSLAINGGTPQTYSWDLNGRLTGIVAPGGAAVGFGYDPMGAVTHKDLPNDVSLDQTLDGVGRVVRMRYSHSVTGVLEDLRYTLNAAGSRIQEVSAEGTTSYFYDHLNQLTMAFYPGGLQEQFTYDAAHNRTQRVSSVPGSMPLSEVTTYNAADQILSTVITEGPPPGGGTGSTSPTTGTTGGGLPPAGGTGGGGESPPSTGGGGTGGGGSGGASGGVVSEFPKTIVYAHDANGNMTGISDVNSSGATVRTTTFVYNGKDQLTQVNFPDSTFALFGYYPDCTCRRLMVTKGGVATRFLWDVETKNLLEDMDLNGNTLMNHLTGQEMDHVLGRTAGGQTHAYMTDQLNTVLALIDSGGARSNSYRYLAFGSPRYEQESVANRFRFTGREWDASTGQQYNRHRHYMPSLGRWTQRDPLGVLELSDAPLRSSRPSSSCLSCSGVGGLTQKDPIGFAGGEPNAAQDEAYAANAWSGAGLTVESAPVTGLNLYVYARSNPLRFRDPLGLGEEALWDAWKMEMESFRRAKDVRDREFYRRRAIKTWKTLMDFLKNSEKNIFPLPPPGAFPAIWWFWIKPEYLPPPGYSGPCRA